MLATTGSHYGNCVEKVDSPVILMADDDEILIASNRAEIGGYEEESAGTGVWKTLVYKGHVPSFLYKFNAVILDPLVTTLRLFNVDWENKEFETRH